jgi:Holliday junction resolvase
MGKINSRAKGAQAERDIANILKRRGYKARRGQQYSGTNGDADVVGLPGFHIEVKRVEKLNLGLAMDQAKRDARKGEVPIVVHRKSRKNWKVTMEFNDFLDLLEGEE